MSDIETFKKNIRRCLKSSEDFRNNFKTVREELAKKNKETTLIFLDIIEGILTSKESPIGARFYSLFFLKIATESHNVQLLSELVNRKNLLKTLEEQATFDKDKEFPERGATFFKTNPTEKEKHSGGNYLALLLEVIKYWNQKYVTEKKKNNVFGLLYRRLVEEHKVPFPSTYHFYKFKDQKSKSEISDDTASLLSPIDPQLLGSTSDPFRQDQQIEWQQQSEQSNYRAQRQENPQRQTPQPKTEDVKKDNKITESEDVKIAKKKLTDLKSVFQELKDLYNHQKAESSDATPVLQFYYESLEESSKAFEEIISIFLSNKDPQGEEVLLEIFQYTPKTSELEQNYKNFIEKRINYAMHRKNALKILEPEGTMQVGTEIGETPSNLYPSPTRTVSNRETFGVYSEPTLSEQALSEPKGGRISLARNQSSGKGEAIEEEKEENYTGRMPEVKTDQEKNVSRETNLHPRQPSPKNVQESKATLFSFDSVVKDRASLESKKAETAANKQIKKEPQVQDAKKKYEPQKEEFPKRIDLFKQDSKKEELGLPQEKPKKESALKKEENTSKKDDEERKLLSRHESKKSEVRFADPTTTTLDQPSPEFSKITTSRPTFQNDNLISKENPTTSNLLSIDLKGSSQSDERTGIIQSKLLQKGVDSTALASLEKEGSKQKEASQQKEAKSQQPPEETKEGSLLKLQKIKSQEEEGAKKTIAQLLKSKSSDPRIEEEKPKQQQKSLSKSIQSNANTSSMKLGSDPKRMERSLKVVREQTTELKKIQEGIKRSFATSQKKLPVILSEEFLGNQDILSKFEQELHLLRHENEALKGTSSVGGLSKQNSLKPDVYEMQKQITDFKKEIEQLKKKNEQLEKNSSKQEQSASSETIKQRLKELESENKTLKKKIEGDPSAKAHFEETQVLNDKIKKLSQENELLTNSMSQLRSENRSLQSRIVEFEDLASSSKVYTKTEESRNSHLIRLKSERGNQKSARPDSPEYLNNQISPKESAQLDWMSKYKSPDNKIFWNGIQGQLSPIETLKYSTHGPATLEKHERYMLSSPIENPLSWRNDFVSPKANNNEIGYKGRVGNAVYPQRESEGSEITSDADEKYETPDEELSGAEDFLDAVSYEQVPPKYNFFGRETNNHAKIESRVGANHQPHHIFTALRGMPEGEFEFEKEEIQSGIEVKDAKGYDYEWVQKLSNKANGLPKAGQRKNPFESEPEFNEVLRGATVSSSQYFFEELSGQLQSVSSSQTLHNFKMACLKSKCPIFESNEIQIGASTSVVQEYSTRKHQLKITLFFSNKTNELITDFTAVLIEGLNLEAVAKPEKVESIITTSKQVKQTILVSFNTVPIGCLQLRCRANCGKQALNFTLFLPTTVNKFMEFKYVEADEFKVKWKAYSANTLKSEEVCLDATIIHSAHDFKKYFAYLVDIEPEDEYDFIRGNKSIKLGGLFDLKEPGTEYALQINYLPSQNIVFQIATSPKHMEQAKFVIQNLVFLFKK